MSPLALAPSFAAGARIASPARARRARRANGVRRVATGAAAPDGGGGGVLDSDAYARGARLVGSWPTQAWFRPAQVAVVIGIAGVVDAGYSGDWSRIGVLTHAQEDVIQSLVTFIAVAHFAVAALATRVAQERGADAGVAFVKAFVCGFLALVDVSYGDVEEGGR